MRPLTKRPTLLLTSLSLLCGGALLPACSSPPERPSAAVAGQVSADDHYRRGRGLYLARRHAEAIAAYQAALRIDARHVDAGNGLAVVYAEQRDFARAIPIWRGLTEGATMASGAAAGFLFSNLGYAYLLDGDDDAARVALEKACLLDPLNARAWQHLGEALQRLGQDERAGQMLRQAGALREHDLRADYALVRGGQPEAIAQAPATAGRPDGEWASIEVASTGNGIYALRRVPAAVRTVPATQVPVRMDDKAQVATLEISNGNGRQGLARLLSRQLREPDVKVVRLTNQKKFNVRQTRVEYQPAFRDVAERLAQRVGARDPVRMGTPGRADVRLVLGRDLPQQRIVRRPAMASDNVASGAGAP
jgi:tetratricopeptide (TPR) repeat protein